MFTQKSPFHSLQSINEFEFRLGPSKEQVRNVCSHYLLSEELLPFVCGTVTNCVSSLLRLQTITLFLRVNSVNYSGNCINRTALCGNLHKKIRSMWCFLYEKKPSVT